MNERLSNAKQASETLTYKHIIQFTNHRSRNTSNYALHITACRYLNHVMFCRQSINFYGNKCIKREKKHTQSAPSFFLSSIKNWNKLIWKLRNSTNFNFFIEIDQCGYDHRLFMRFFRAFVVPCIALNFTSNSGGSKLQNWINFR